MIIGLAGGKGCGKSSVARILERKYGYEILSFASPIKDMLRAMGLRDSELNDPVLKEIKLELELKLGSAHLKFTSAELIQVCFSLLFLT